LAKIAHQLIKMREVEMHAGYEETLEVLGRLISHRAE
jgi:hypothetical protein